MQTITTQQNLLQPYSPIVGEGLGASYSSYTQIGPLIKHRSFGQAGVRLFANVANGNVYLEDTLLTLQTGAGPLTVGYVYNSQGKTPTDGAWRFRIKRLILKDNVPYQLEEEDGHVTQYTHDKDRDEYVAPVHGNGTPFFSYDAEKKLWKWFRPGQTFIEYYDTDGLLKQRISLEGRVLTYEYDHQNRPLGITDDSNYGCHFKYGSGSVGLYAAPSGGVLCVWSFDDKGRLLSRKVTDNNFPKGEYTTDYHYNADTTLVTQVTQTDGGLLSIQYVTNDTMGRRVLDYFRMGKDGPFHRFHYATQQTPGQASIDNSAGGKLTLFFDNKYRLARLDGSRGYFPAPSEGTDTTGYQYSETGLLAVVAKPSGAETHYQYGLYDVLAQKTKPNGQIIQYGYYQDRLSSVPYRFLSRTRWDGKQRLTEFVVYDASPVDKGFFFVRFRISPEGRVTEYRPDKRGNVASTREYLLPFYPVNTLPPNSPISMEEMNKWVAGQDPAKVALNETVFSANNQMITKKTYAEVDAKGNGIETNALGYINDSWDLFNQRIIHYARLQDDKKTYENYGYDALLRPIICRKPLIPPTTWQYQLDSGGNYHVTATRPDQSTLDLALTPGGLVAQQIETDPGTEGTSFGAPVSRVTTFACDMAGRPVRITLPSGEFRYVFYDKENRLGYEVSPLGTVTQYVYDRVHRYHSKTVYAKLIDPSKLYNEKYPDFLPSAGMLQKLIQPDASEDRTSYVFFDGSGRAKYEVSAQGALTENLYDSADRKIGTIAYADLISEEELTSLKADKPINRPFDPTKDRAKHVFYDADGLVVAKQDAAGYFTQFVRDGGGRVRAKVRYKTPLPITDTLPVFNPSDVYSTELYYWDNANHLIAKVDADNYLTTYAYEGDGLRVGAHAYATPLSSPPDINQDPSAFLPPVTENDEVASYQYDLLARLTEGLLPNVVSKSNAYDDMGRLTATTVHDGLVEDVEAQTSHYKRYGAFGQVVQECPPPVAELIDAINANPHLGPEEKKKQIEAVWATKSVRYAYDETGLKLSKSPFKIFI